MSIMNISAKASLIFDSGKEFEVYENEWNFLNFQRMLKNEKKNKLKRINWNDDCFFLFTSNYITIILNQLSCIR